MRTGLGIRPELFGAIENQRPKLGFLEAHSENYFGDSLNRSKLIELRQDYQVSLHGVGLSLGRRDGLNPGHLDKLKRLIDEIEPLLVSEHLAWSAYSHRHLPDLLPLPLTEQSLAVMCNHIEQMQEALQQRILVENPSNYLLFDQLQIPEPEFLNSLAERTGCGLLVDINNIYVSAHNLQRNPGDYLAQLNTDVIGQYHLAGFTQVDLHGEQLLIDTHNHTVFEPVWQLFEQTLKQHGARPTLFEWDSDFPGFEILLGECEHADQLVQNVLAERSTLTDVAGASRQPAGHLSEAGDSTDQLAMDQQLFLDQVLNRSEVLAQAIEPHQHRIQIYQNNVFAAISDYLLEVYPAVAGVVGEDFFKQMAHALVRSQPPDEGNIHVYGQQFAAVLAEFDALSEMPYLSDLIDYEWALHHAYFCTPVDGIEHSQIDQQQLLTMPVTFNRGVRVLNSDFPIYEIHRQSLPAYTGNVAIDLGQSQDSLLVYRQNFAVMTRKLTTEEAVFLDKLDNSKNMMQAIEGLHGSLSEQILADSLAMVFELGLLSASKQ